MKDDDGGGEVRMVLNRQMLGRTTRMEEAAAGDGVYSGLQ